MDKFLRVEEEDSPQKFKGMDDFGKARSKFKKLAFDDSELVEADNSPDIVQPFDLDDLTRKRALTRTNTVKNL